MTKRARRRGVTVVLAGPDGVGKSTISAGLREHFGADVVVVFWHRASVLPARTSPATATLADPHARPPYGRLPSVLKVCYLFGDVWLGWLIRIRPLRRAGRVVILERGWWDIVVDPARYRVQGVQRLARMLGAVSPRPDTTIVLTGSPEVVAARKDDLPPAEIARQMTVWTSVARGRRMRVVDPGRPAASVVRDVIEEIGRRGGPPGLSG